MKYGVRELCNVVLKAKDKIQIGNNVFYKDEPVLFFDSLKTTSIENQTQSVYAQGGRGNGKLVAWEGERNVSFVMEDALLSPISFLLLSGGEMRKASNSNPVFVHKTEYIQLNESNFSKQTDQVSIDVKGKPNTSKYSAQVMIFDSESNECSEPYISYSVPVQSGYSLVITKTQEYSPSLMFFKNGVTVVADYYEKQTSNITEIVLTPEVKNYNFYLEADALMRNTLGQDKACQFILPKCRIQNNFTFTMASSGDPSTFTFTLDTFPNYTKFDKSKKVLCAVQLIEGEPDDDALEPDMGRVMTPDGDLIIDHDAGEVGDVATESYDGGELS